MNDTDTNRIDFAALQRMIFNEPLAKSTDEIWRYPEFVTWPASLSFHHAYEGGLMAHTIEVTDYALKAAEAFPNVRKDILITAALWHDVMKILEYKIVDWSVQEKNDAKANGVRFLVRNDDATGCNVWIGNPYAKTIGHIAGSAAEFTAVARQCGVPQDDIDAVVHCLLSHHGPVREWGSPVTPQTLEAMLLHQADMLSAKFGATR